MWRVPVLSCIVLPGPRRRKILYRLTQWKTDIGGKLSAMTAGAGKIFVAAIDQHTIHALDVDTGLADWTYTTGGRIDSPPTVVGELVLFGCAGGA